MSTPVVDGQTTAKDGVSAQCKMQVGSPVQAPLGRAWKFELKVVTSQSQSLNVAVSIAVRRMTIADRTAEG